MKELVSLYSELCTARMGQSMLTSTEEVIGRWKEHFKELLNPTNLPTIIEAEQEDDGGLASVFLEEVTEVNNFAVAKPQILMIPVRKCKRLWVLRGCHG